MFGQQRSQSGPSLSINTNSANSLSVPNNNASQASQPGGLFGSTKPSLFGTTNTTQASQASGLFGTASTQQNGGLFGSQTSGNLQQQTSGASSGGLFGTSTTSTQPQQQGGGLFGSQPSQQQGGGLFGSTNMQQTPAQQGGSLFGSLGQSQNQGPQAQQSTGSSLFSNTSIQNKPTLFGNQPRPSFTSQTSNLASSQQPPRSMFSSSIGQYSQQQQPIPGVRVDLSGIRPTTRFNDLYEDVQKIVEAVDNFILAQMHFQEECEQAMPRVESSFSYIPTDVDFCAQKLDVMQQSLENDAAAIDSSKKLVKKDASDARLSFKVTQNLRMPTQFQHTNLWNMPAASANTGLTLPDEGSEDGAGTNLVTYFCQQADEMAKSLESYKKSIADVESYLRGVEANTVQQVQRMQFSMGRDGGERNADDQIRELAAVLREFENGILGVAGEVGAVREQVQGMMLGEGMSKHRGRVPF